GDVDGLAVEGDAAQAAVPAAALPIDRSSVPVDRPADVAPFEVNEVYATVALALVRASDDGRRDELHVGNLRAGRAVRAIILSARRRLPLLAEREPYRARTLQRPHAVPARLGPGQGIVSPRAVVGAAH